MTIKQITHYKLWFLKWSRERELQPGEEFIIYEDRTTGWESRPGRNWEYTTVRVESPDKLTLAYGVPPLDESLKPFENPQVKEEINELVHPFQDTLNNRVEFKWNPGKERR